MYALTTLLVGAILLAGCSAARSSINQSLACGNATLAINCGAAGSADDAGTHWLADRGFFDGVATPDLGKDAAGRPLVCRSERYGMSGFWVPIENGLYDVRLTFCESYAGVTKAGQRTFNVEVEGVRLRDVDPFRDGGGVGKASTREVRVNVRDGKLDVRFEAVSQSPQINAIAITRITSDRPMNAPAGFDKPRDVPHGKITTLRYPSRTAGYDRPASLYTPPGYDPTRTYPMLVLLHGGPGHPEAYQDWNKKDDAATILDNAIASGQAVPMLVLMPLGTFHPPTTQPTDDPTARFRQFERDLIDDLIPYVSSHYSIGRSADQRALAGFSMGGGQTGWIGPGNPDVFGSLGFFSAGMLGGSGNLVRDHLPDGATLNPRLKVCWVSVGDHDRYYPGVLRVLEAFDARGIRYEWRMLSGSHESKVARESLYLFATRLFR